MRRSHAVPGMLITLCGLIAVFAFLLFTSHEPIVLTDGLRHFTMAQKFRESGLGIGWGDFFFRGYYTEHNFDPWFLSDVFIIPFTFFPDIATGTKAATLVFTMLLGAAFTLALRTVTRSGTALGIALALLLLGDPLFLIRLGFGRPYILITACFLLAYAGIRARRPVWVGIAVALSVLLSQLFVFTLGFASLGVLWLLIRREWRAARRIFVALLIGLICGFLLHPDPALYVQHMLTFFFRVPFLGRRIGLAHEMTGGLPYLGILLPIFFVALCGILIDLNRRHVLQGLFHERPDFAFLLGITLFFLILFVLWGRAIDFLWPLLILSVFEIVTTETFSRELWERNLRRNLPPWILRYWPLFLVLLLFGSALPDAYPLFRNPTGDYASFSAIAMLPPGSRVLNIDYEVFCPLVSWNDRVLYARGISSATDYLYDPEEFALLDRSLLHDGMKEEENTAIDVGGWIRELRQRFSPDYFAVYPVFHPWLIGELERIPAVQRLTGTGGGIVLYSFRRLE